MTVTKILTDRAEILKQDIITAIIENLQVKGIFDIDFKEHITLSSNGDGAREIIESLDVEKQSIKGAIVYGDCTDTEEGDTYYLLTLPIETLLWIFEQVETTNYHIA
jgi:hypothetical protein